MREIYRRMYPRPIRLIPLLAIVTVVSAAGGGLLTAFSLAFHSVLDFQEEKVFSIPVVFAIFYFRTGLCAGWSFLYFALRHIRESARRDLQLAQAETDRERAELQMLRAQMNPHFILNALNTILASVGKDVRHAKALIRALAQYLQFSLKNRANDLVPLSEELEAVRGFIEVECARYPGDWIFDCAVEDRTLNDLVPGIFLQPLIENAIKYGKLTSAKPRHLFLRTSHPSAETLAVEVRNSGHWIQQENTEDPARGVGLSNLRQRLEALYPGRHTFEVDEQGGCVSVRINVPIA